MRSKIERFEDLVAWQKARVLTAAIYQMTNVAPFAKDFALRDQMRRAAVSITSNIAEGFERGKPSEFHQFLSMAKGSCGEVRSQLYVALDAGYLSPDTFATILAQTQEVGRIIGALRASIERRRDAL
jgi:four helix bundle protein